MEHVRVNLCSNNHLHLCSAPDLISFNITCVTTHSPQLEGDSASHRFFNDPILSFVSLIIFRVSCVF